MSDPRLPSDASGVLRPLPGEPGLAPSVSTPASPDLATERVIRTPVVHPPAVDAPIPEAQFSSPAARRSVGPGLVLGVILVTAVAFSGLTFLAVNAANTGRPLTPVAAINPTASAPASAGGTTTPGGGSATVCSDLVAFRAALAGLAAVDPTALGGADAVKALDRVKTTAAALQTSIGADMAPEVGAFVTALDGLKTAVDDLASGRVASNPSAVGASLAAVGLAWNQLEAKLATACPS